MGHTEQLERVGPRHQAPTTACGCGGGQAEGRGPQTSHFHPQGLPRKVARAHCQGAHSSILQQHHFYWPLLDDTQVSTNSVSLLCSFLNRSKLTTLTRDPMGDSKSLCLRHWCLRSYSCMKQRSLVRDSKTARDSDSRGGTPGVSAD